MELLSFNSMDVDTPSDSELAAGGRVCIPAILPLVYDCEGRYGSGFVRIGFSFPLFT